MSGDKPRAAQVIRFELPDGTPVTVARGVPLDGPLGALVRQHAPGALPLASDPEPVTDGLPTATARPTTGARRKTQE